jgi:hypothetical protein
MIFNIAYTVCPNEIIQVEADDIYSAIDKVCEIYSKKKLTPNIDYYIEHYVFDYPFSKELT